MRSKFWNPKELLVSDLQDLVLKFTYTAFLTPFTVKFRVPYTAALGEAAVVTMQITKMFEHQIQGQA